MTATKSSWKNHPIPEQKELIPFNEVYSISEAKKISQGFVPCSMEDKWFIYTENECVSFHRSWTGHCIFRIELETAIRGVRVKEAWVNRDQAQYQSDDVDNDIRLLKDLIQNKLLIRDVEV